MRSLVVGGASALAAMHRAWHTHWEYSAMPSAFDRALDDATHLLQDLRGNRSQLSVLEVAADVIERAFRSGGKVLACGNGGSMADAMHFCEEWTGRFRDDRQPYPAFPLSDATHLTCVANDFGFEQVFARAVRAYGSQGDVLLVLSTSGNSLNLIEASRAARAKGLHVIGFLGRGGGELISLCDTAFVAPGETSDRIQELHMLCLHALIETIEDRLSARS